MDDLLFSTKVETIATRLKNQVELHGAPRFGNVGAGVSQDGEAHLLGADYDERKVGPVASDLVMFCAGLRMYAAGLESRPRLLWRRIVEALLDGYNSGNAGLAEFKQVKKVLRKAREEDEERGEYLQEYAADKYLGDDGEFLEVREKKDLPKERLTKITDPQLLDELRTKVLAEVGSDLVSFMGASDLPSLQFGPVAEMVSYSSAGSTDKPKTVFVVRDSETGKAATLQAKQVHRDAYNIRDRVQTEVLGSHR